PLNKKSFSSIQKSYRQLSLTGAVGETSMADGQRLGRAHRSQPGSSSAISSNRRHRRLPEKTSEDTLTKVTTLEPESGPRLNNLAQKDTASPSPTQIKVRQHSNVNVIRNNIPHTTRTSNTGTTGRLVTEGSRISPGTVVPGGIPYISYQELSDATECFHKDNLLGRGGFGAVYLGTWKGTRVAIKRMEPRIRNQAVGHHEDFFVEYAVLNQFRHTNILELFGVSSSDDGNAVCLIYKFMKNGSLQDRLNCKGGTAPLTWEQRVSIALGVACGLRYLHTLSSKPIVHGDIKSANILLDEALTPKLGDFGLAREGPDGIATHVEVLYDMSTGKCGYVMMGGVKRPHREAVEAAWKSGTLDGLRDERPLVSRAGDIIFRRFIELGRKCTAYQRQARPGMVQVHEMLLAIQAEVEKLVESPTRELSLSVSSSVLPGRRSVEGEWDIQAKLISLTPRPKRSLVLWENPFSADEQKENMAPSLRRFSVPFSNELLEAKEEQDLTGQGDHHVGLDDPKAEREGFNSVNPSDEEKNKLVEERDETVETEEVEMVKVGGDTMEKEDQSVRVDVQIAEASENVEMREVDATGVEIEKVDERGNVVEEAEREVGTVEDEDKPMKPQDENRTMEMKDDETDENAAEEERFQKPLSEMEVMKKNVEVVERDELEEEIVLTINGPMASGTRRFSKPVKINLGLCRPSTRTKQSDVSHSSLGPLETFRAPRIRRNEDLQETSEEEASLRLCLPSPSSKAWLASNDETEELSVKGLSLAEKVFSDILEKESASSFEPVQMQMNNLNANDADAAPRELETVREPEIPVENQKIRTQELPASNKIEMPDIVMTEVEHSKDAEVPSFPKLSSGEKLSPPKCKWQKSSTGIVFRSNSSEDSIALRRSRVSYEQSGRISATDNVTENSVHSCNKAPVPLDISESERLMADEMSTALLKEVQQEEEQLLKEGKRSPFHASGRNLPPASSSALTRAKTLLLCEDPVSLTSNLEGFQCQQCEILLLEKKSWVPNPQFLDLQQRLENQFRYQQKLWL
ncbi:unnamed protein product, partial [Cyprideis torosa]